MTRLCRDFRNFILLGFVAVVLNVSSAHTVPASDQTIGRTLSVSKPLHAGRQFAQTTVPGRWGSGVALPPSTGRPTSRPGTSSGRVRTTPRRPRPSGETHRDRGNGSRFGIDKSRITTSGGKSGRRTVKPKQKTRPRKKTTTVDPCGRRPQTSSDAYRRWRSCKKRKQRTVKSVKQRLPKGVPANNISIPPLPVAQAVALETDNDRRPDEIVVVVASQSVATELVNSLNLQLLESRASDLLAGELAHFRIPDGRSVPAVVAALNSRVDVELAAPNHVYRLQSDESLSQYAVKLIRFTEVDDTNRGQGVRIGIVDTALDQNHPALRGVAIEAFDALKGTPVKQVRHGTAIAGLIGGRKNVRGLAPSAKILSTRAFDGQTPEAVTSDARTLLEALDWLAKKDAQLINLSFAGSPNVLLRRALAAARQRGILLVAAAGNGGPKARALYPGAYPTTIAVTATDQKSKIYDRANRGDYVFLAAPGVDLLVPTGNNGYDVMSGTSFAAAIVTGLAALRVRRVAKASAKKIAADLEKVLQLSTSDLGPKGRDRIFGHGLIDAARLMQK